MKTKLFCFMKNAIATLILLLATIYIKAQCDLTKSQDAFFEPADLEIKNEFTRGLVNANSFQLKVDPTTLPVLRKAFPKQQPRFSYFWNFRDGNFLITEEYLGETLHNYLEEGTYNLKVEITPIKVPEKDTKKLAYVNENIVVENILARSSINHTEIPQERITYLYNNRCALRGQPITIISSIKSKCNEIVDLSEAKLEFYNDQITLDDLEIYYGDDLEDCIVSENKTTILVNVYNIKPNEQRNFFTPFIVDPKLDIGDSIKICLTYTYECNNSLVSETNCFGENGNALNVAKAHDPNFKQVENIFNDPCMGEQKTMSNVEIQFLNDGKKSTDSVRIVDFIDPLSTIGNITWYPTNTMYQTKYQMKSGFLKKYNDSIEIRYPNLKLKGTKEPAYLTNFYEKDTKDQINFDMEFELKGEPTFYCNFADIYFDNLPKITTKQCYKCKNGMLLTTYDTLMPFPNVPLPQLVTPLLFKNDYRIIQGQSITLVPDISLIPSNSLDYFWLPNGEITPTITVSPQTDQLYQLLISWTQNNITYCADGQTIVEVDKCIIEEDKILEIIEPITCHNEKNGSAEILITDESINNYVIEWSDVIKDPSTSGFFKRDSLYNDIYYYTVRDTITGCTIRNSIVIADIPPIILEYIIIKNTDNKSVNIETLVYGGEPGYIYSWFSNGNLISSDANINNVPFGVYDIEVADSNNKTIITTIKATNADAGVFNCD